MSQKVKIPQPGPVVDVITRDFGPIRGTLTELSEKASTLVTHTGITWIVGGRHILRTERVA